MMMMMMMMINSVNENCLYCLPGCHTINVLYANSAICGSPFCVDVFNPSAVGFVEPLPQCFVIGKPVCFKGK